jgi:hypothetical protein
MTENPDDTAARQPKLPRMTALLDNKVKGSSNVADALDFVDQGPPKEGDSRSITSMTPVGSRTTSGNAAPSWPANKGSSYMFYGKGPR